MGCCQSADLAEQKQMNKEINTQIKRDRSIRKSEVKLLLLGAGESGKSTILKQMKLIHDGGYTADERESFKEVIFNNTIQSMKVTLEAMSVLGIQLQRPQNVRHRQLVLETSSEVRSLDPKLVTAIASLWEDKGVRYCVARSGEFQLNDSAKYYFDSIGRIGQANYIPSDQDVLRSRVKTTGITETTFLINNITYRMFDVGGQRSERKKWIHCFENVTAIVFMVGISEYDQVLIEDTSMNRLQESLTLFDSICNSKWFTKTSIILFLNKIDLFADKLSRSPLGKHFPDYMGGPKYEAATQYLLNRFTSLNSRTEAKQVYSHFTCATDTHQVKFVMSSVSTICVHNNLRDGGLL